MKKLIGVVDLASGTITNRRQDALTLDIPSDLDRSSGGVSVSADRVGRYVTAAGQNRVYFANPRLLSGRAPGEECLIAAAGIETNGETCTRRYRIAMVDLEE
jgi:hypothetical protein